MHKKERLIVFSVGVALLAIFTFTDLQISMILYTKSLYGRIFEIIGELPFVFLSLFGGCLLFRFRSKKNLFLNLFGIIGSTFLIVTFTFMGGFMTQNYLSENIGNVSPLFGLIVGIFYLTLAILL